MPTDGQNPGLTMVGLIAELLRMIDDREAGPDDPIVIDIKASGGLYQATSVERRDGMPIMAPTADRPAHFGRIAGLPDDKWGPRYWTIA